MLEVIGWFLLFLVWIITIGLLALFDIRTRELEENLKKRKKDRTLPGSVDNSNRKYNPGLYLKPRGRL